MDAQQLPVGHYPSRTWGRMECGLWDGKGVIGIGWLTGRPHTECADCKRALGIRSTPGHIDTAHEGT